MVIYVLEQQIWPAGVFQSAKQTDCVCTERPSLGIVGGRHALSFVCLVVLLHLPLAFGNCSGCCCAMLCNAVQPGWPSFALLCYALCLLFLLASFAIVTGVFVSPGFRSSRAAALICVCCW